MTDDAIALLHEYEGCELVAYRCPADKWTIGYGNTYYQDGSPVQEGDVLTQEEADGLFRETIDEFYEQVEGLVFEPAWSTEIRLSGLTCLVYNIGVRAFRRSTVLLRINEGESDERIAEAWSWWNKAGGKTLKGLVRRREAEIELALG